MARILIVDDNISVTIMMEDLLKSQGHTIYSAYNGTDALEMTTRLLPDLVLLDVDMPGLDGITICKKLRKQKSTQLIPIVILTGKKDSKTLMEGVKAGCDDFLTKPVDLPVLKARVDTLLMMSYLRNQLAEKEKFETTINHIHSGIIITDPEGRIKNFNSSARQMFSLNTKSDSPASVLEVIGKNFKTNLDRWESIISKNEGSFIVYRADSDYKLRYALEIKFRVILNPLCEIDEVVFVASEETERINEDNRKDLFLTMLRHKFTTVEAITKLSMESLAVLTESVDPALEKAAIEGLHKASANLNTIMKKLIKYVQMTSHRGTIQSDIIDELWFRESLQTIADSLLLDQDLIKLDWQEIPEFTMNADGMYSILFELIENGIKFGDPAHPQIDITVIAEESWIRITIGNTGDKIPQEELNRIWDRFYQVDQDITGQVKGIGLGMSIVKYITTLAGGKVEISSASGKTEVSILIPIHYSA